MKQQHYSPTRGEVLEPTEARQANSRKANLRVLIFSTGLIVLIFAGFVLAFLYATPARMDGSSKRAPNRGRPIMFLQHRSLCLRRLRRKIPERLCSRKSCQRRIGWEIIVEAAKRLRYAPFRHTPAVAAPRPNSLTPPHPLSMVRAVDLPAAARFPRFWMV